MLNPKQLLTIYMIFVQINYWLMQSWILECFIWVTWATFNFINLKAVNKHTQELLNSTECMKGERIESIWLQLPQYNLVKPLINFQCWLYYVDIALWNCDNKINHPQQQHTLQSIRLGNENFWIGKGGHETILKLNGIPVA